MWAMLLPALAGLGLGYLKQKEAAKNEQADRILAGQTQALSPWTKLQAEKVQRAPGMLSAMGEGALQGASFGQGIQSMQGQQALQESTLKNQDAQTDLYSRLLSQQQAQQAPQNEDQYFYPRKR